MLTISGATGAPVLDFGHTWFFYALQPSTFHWMVTHQCAYSDHGCLTSMVISILTI